MRYASPEPQARLACRYGRSVDAGAAFDGLGVTGAVCAAAVTGEGAAIGFNADQPVVPASVMKVQIALAVENAIADGSLIGRERRRLPPEDRTPGPVGVSLMSDEVSMSVRDLVVAMLTISDNVATDELLDVVGLEQVNRTTQQLGLEHTLITSSLKDMLHAMAVEAGFSNYAALVDHDPDIAGEPSEEEVRMRIARSSELDPARGSRTTATDTIALLQAIWTDGAGPAQACTAVRQAMSRQLTRHRIASGFGPEVTVCAKSGGLMGIVRNEAGVVTFPDGDAYAIAVFSQRRPGQTINPALVDAGIGRIARAITDEMRASHA
jgi:beta-lactamase class A